jgi:MFS family permease
MAQSPAQAVPAQRAVRLSDLDRRARQAASGAFFGFFVDYFDIYLPIVALAPALAYFEPSGISQTLRTTLFYLTFAVTLIGRPIGAFIFGHLGDVIGRKRTTVIAIGGAGAATLVTAFLPGYAAWSYASLGLLIALRLIGGIFMGGEYTSANPLALEAAPANLRGLIGGGIAAAYPCGYLAISIVTTIVLQFMPSTGPASSYAQWGWRIPFLVGAALVLAFLLYFRRVQESQTWESEVTSASSPPRAPLKELFRGTNLRNLGQVFLLMTGLWLGVQAAISAPSALLIDYFKLPSGSVTNALLIANVFLAAGYVTAGILGQRFGRRRMLIAAGIWTAIAAPAAYGLMVAAAGSARASIVVVAMFATIQLVLTVSPWGIITAYIVERFPTAVRASGYGIGYSLAVVVPSFYSFYMLGLGKVMPYAYTPLVLIFLGGLFTLAGALIGPETRHVDLLAVPVAEGLRP